MVRLRSKNDGRFLRMFLPVVAITLWASAACALDGVNTTFFGVAIKGYDTVAYHTQGRAGQPAFEIDRFRERLCSGGHGWSFRDG